MRLCINRKVIVSLRILTHRKFLVILRLCTNRKVIVIMRVLTNRKVIVILVSCWTSSGCGSSSELFSGDRLQILGQAGRPQYAGLDVIRACFIAALVARLDALWSVDCWRCVRTRAWRGRTFYLIHFEAPVHSQYSHRTVGLFFFCWKFLLTFNFLMISNELIWSLLTKVIIT